MSDVVAAREQRADRDPGRGSAARSPPRVRRRVHAIANTIAAASSPNAQRADRQQRDRARGTRAGSAPRRTPAPPVTPITSGEASGLASAPCSSAPATPSAAPTRIARRRVRGSRSPSDDLPQRPGVGAVPSSASTDVGRRHAHGAEGQRRGRAPPPAPAARDHRRRPSGRSDRQPSSCRNLRPHVADDPAATSVIGLQQRVAGRRRRRGCCATALRRRATPGCRA